MLTRFTSLVARRAPRHRTSILAALVYAGAATVVHAQERTIVLRQNGNVLATEQYAAAGDTVSTHVSIPAVGLDIRSRLETSAAAPRLYRTEVQTPQGPQLAQIEFDRDTVLIQLQGRGTTVERRLARSPGQPLVVFQNFAWAILEPTLRGLMADAVGTPRPVSVYLVDAAKLESWTARRTAADAVSLTTPSGLVMEFAFAGGRLTSVKVPSQSLEAHAER